MIKSKKQMFVVIGAFILVMMLTTVTYAFFNYTRTGVANRIQLGRIYFNSEQTSINLTNVFPIDKANVDTDTDNVGSVTIHVTGDTTYTDGIEYLVSVVDTNIPSSTISRNNPLLPVSVDVSFSSSVNKTIGENDHDYFDNRGGNTSLYRVLVGDTIYENANLAVGYIAKGATGIDGNINIKAYLDKDKIAISDTYPTRTVRIVNPNLTEDDINVCKNYFINKHYFSSSSDFEGFCRGTTKISGYTFQEMLDSDRLIYNNFIPELLELNIIIELYDNETTNEWANGRVVLTTSEWNSLQNTPLSFKVKVEANEGIWVHEQGNSMGKLPSFYPVNSSINAIYFERMNSNEMSQRYESANYKEDITYNGEGKVLTWLENDTENNSGYIMYVASDGTTALTQADDLFGMYNYVEIIEFHNVNTSRVTDMNHMFNYLYDLKELDVSSFDTSNVTKMHYFISKCSKIEKINMSGLDLRNAETMQHMIGGNSLLNDLDLSGIKTRDVTNMGEMLYGDYALESVDLSGWGGDNLTSVSAIFGGCSAMKVVNMSGFNFGKVTDIGTTLFANRLYNVEEIDLSGIKIPYVTSLFNMFASCEKLSTLNLDNIDTSSVINMGNMFYGCSSLTSIDLSGFDTSKVENMGNMFYNCISLVNLDLGNINMASLNCSNMFYNCTSLKIIDLSRITTIGVAYNLFNNATALTTIYVSEDLDFSNQPDNMPIFGNNTSLVGGAGTAFDANNPVDKTYAKIDGGESNPGYFTLKTN